MKNLLLILSCVLTLSSYTLAQGIVNINGTITDANGTPMPNYLVDIISDTASGTLFTAVAYTNSNGVYSSNITVGNTTQGSFDIMVQDSCTISILTQTVSYSTNNMVFNNIDFAVCSITPSNCQAGLYYQTTPSGAYSFTSTQTGGVGPYSYLWNFGNGLTSTSQNPIMTYASNGTYYPCLTITDANGCVSNYCDSLGIIIGGSGTNCSTSFSAIYGGLTIMNFTSNVVGTGAISYSWDFGDGNTSTLANPSHTYNVSGTYNISLTTTDASGCSSTHSSTETIPCIVLISLVKNELTLNFTSTPNGTAPFTYSWDFGDGVGTSTQANPTYTYTNTGHYSPTLTVVDATGCSTTNFTGFIACTDTEGTYKVYVHGDSLASNIDDQAIVHIIQHDTIAGTLTAIRTDTTKQGYVTFRNLPFGNYLVKAALLPSHSNYSNFLPTYHTQSLVWSNATPGNVNHYSIGLAIIPLIRGNNIGTGSGFIGGFISQGANGPGDPVDGALVILYDANMNPIGYTYSDEDGDYSFDNLPYGTYYVYIEELGLQSTPVEVVLSPTTQSMDQVHFEIGSNYVMFTSVNDIQAISKFNVFPNPVIDQLYMQIDLEQIIDAEISITNMAGQVLRQRQVTLNSGNHVIDFNVNELPTGIYTIHLKSNTDIIIRKFVKQ